MLLVSSQLNKFQCNQFYGLQNGNGNVILFYDEDNCKLITLYAGQIITVYTEVYKKNWCENVEYIQKYSSTFSHQFFKLVITSNMFQFCRCCHSPKCLLFQKNTCIMFSSLNTGLKTGLKLYQSIHEKRVHIVRLVIQKLT